MTTTTAAPTVEQLVAIGGSEWQRGDYHRVYFNNLQTLYGLETSRYGSGNIQSASLRGEGISNSAAAKLVGKLSGKIWFDVTDSKFYSQLQDNTLGFEIIAIIRAKLATS